MDVEAIFEQFTTQGFSGSALVRHGTTTLVDRASGLADRERGLPNGPETEFQLASISKHFTAAAVLLLQESGKLSVGDPVSRWLPESPDAWRSITLHQLLTHTSGLGHWAEGNSDYPELSLYEAIPRSEAIHIFARSPLKFQPGSTYSYSSPGYVLLAEIVERASGTPYASFLRDRVFRPLGMESTGAGNHAPHPEREAVGYLGEERTRLFELGTVGAGAGDVWSTTSDMARWDTAISSNALLSRESLALMLSGHVDAPDVPLGAQYGYGWFVGALQGHRVLFHPGHNAGFSAINILMPDDALIVILLSNREDTDLLGIIASIIGAVLNLAQPIL